MPLEDKLPFCSAKIIAIKIVPVKTCSETIIVVCSQTVGCMPTKYGDNREREYSMNPMESTETHGQEPTDEDFFYELLSEMRLP